MDADIVVAIIGLIEATVVIVLPFLISKYNDKKTLDRAKKKLLPHNIEPSGDKTIDNDIEQIFNQALQVYQSSSTTSIYLRKYDVSIELEISGDNIKVSSSYTLCFVNPYKIDYTFKRKPMLQAGVQYDTYTWKNIVYQGKSCNEYVRNYPQHEQQTPNNNYLFKSGIEVPLVKEHAESVLHYSSEYVTEAANFFNTFRFWHYCKMFSIDVRLVGPEADKYKIQWEVFLSTNRKNSNFERNVHCDEPKHVSLSDHGWIFPSDGYVITINKIV